MRMIMKWVPATLVILALSTQSFGQKKPPPPPPPPPKLPASVSIEPAGPTISIEEFYKKNPSVKEVRATKGDEIAVELKNGNKEEYNLRNDSERKSFLDKYGAFPQLPPPPPPPPPVKRVT